MKFLLFLSNMMIPLIIFYIVGFGFLMKRNIYEDFVDGAADGLKTVVRIMPTMKFLSPLGFPGELVPLSVVKMFSSSAATGLLLDIYKKFGTDSETGLIASLLLSSTETIFYTMSVYFIAAKVTKTRYTLSGALLATLGGTIASVILAGMM